MQIRIVVQLPLNFRNALNDTFCLFNYKILYVSYVVVSFSILYLFIISVFNISDPNCHFQDFLERLNSSEHREIGSLRKQFFKYVFPELRKNGKLQNLGLFVHSKDRQIQSCVVQELRHAIYHMKFETCEIECLFEVIGKLSSFVEDRSVNTNEGLHALQLYFTILADLTVTTLVYEQVNQSQSKSIYSHMKRTEDVVNKIYQREKKRKTLSSILINFREFIAKCIKMKHAKCSFALLKNWGDARVQDGDVKSYMKHIPNASPIELYMVVMALVYKVSF